MKKLILALLLITSSFAVFSQGNGNSYKEPVLVEATEFKADYSLDRVTLSWKRYKRDDLKYYKIVKSKTEKEPVYPDNGYIYYTTNSYDTEYVDNNLEPGLWYYRLCIITNGGDRWVSPVKAIEISEKTKVPDASDFE